MGNAVSAPVLPPPPSSPPQAAPRRMRQSVVPMLALLTLVAGYLVAPAVWQWTAAEAHKSQLDGPDHITEQVSSISAPTSPADLVARLRAAPTSAQSGPMILTYHDIGYGSSEYTVAPEDFAQQMQLLLDAGWKTVTCAQLTDWLAGRPWPPHTAMITFDDGARGVWKYADPILARYGQHAVAYIITGFVGTRTPYYMTWPELSQMYASGRWDLEAHTHLGHVQVPVNANGDVGPFLTSLEYLGDKGRLETAAEYRTRVTNDLLESKRQLVAHGMPEPKFFAYPFSANAPAAAGPNVLAMIVGSLFSAAMLDQAGIPTSTTTANLADRDFARMDTTAGMSLADWAAKLVAASPLDPANATSFTRDSHEWTSSNGDGVAMPVDGRSGVTVNPGPGKYTSYLFAPVRTSLWRRYTVEATFSGFVRDGDGTTTGLIALSQDPQQLEIGISAAYYQVIRGGGDGHVVAQGPLTSAPSHRVEVRLDTARATVLVDGKNVAEVPLTPSASGFGPAGGISIFAQRESVGSPIPRFSDLVVR